MSFFFETRLQPAHHNVKHGNKNQIQERGRNHAAEDGSAYRPAADAARAFGHDQRQHAQDEGKRGHQNRAQADTGGFDGGVDNAAALFAQLLREFDNQDGILARKANEHDQADLAVDVVLLTAQRLRADGAQQRGRNCEQHDKRKRKAFVLRGERQIHHQNSQAEEHDRLAAGLNFFQRQAGPFIGETGWQGFRCQILHGFNRLTGTFSGSRGPVDFRVAEKIVVADHLRRSVLLQNHQIFQRHHHSRAGAYVIFLDITRFGAELFIGLDVHAVGPVVEFEIVDVDRAHVDLQCVGDLGQGNAQRFRFFAIEGQHELRVVGAEAAEQAGQVRVLVSSLNDFLGGVGQRLNRRSALVFQDKLEAAELAQPLHRGWCERHHLRAVNSRQRAAQPVQHGIAGMFFAFALVECFQAGKNQRAIGCAAAEAESGHGKGAVHLRHFSQYGFHLGTNGGGVFQRRAGWCLHRDDQVAAIFRGDESLGDVLVHPVGHSENAEKQQNRDVFETQDETQQIFVAAGKRCQRAVERTKDPAANDVLVPQKNGGKGRGQRERIERRNRNGKGDGQRELAKQNSSGTGEKCHRNENRYEHQRSRDHSAGHFAHGDRRGVVRLRNSFGDVALHVFDDHDGVVDHQAGGESQTEKRERIDGEAQNFNEGQSSNQRNRNGDGRNESAAPILQENKNHQHYQADGFEQSVQNVFDRFAHHTGGVKGHCVLDAGWEVLGKPEQFRFRGFVDGERVGPGELGDTEADRVVAIEAKIAAVILSAQFGAAYVAQSNQRAVGASFQNNIFEFRWLDQAAHGAHADLVILPADRGRLPHLSGADLHVLLGQRAEDVGGGQVARRHAQRVQPQAHGIFALAEILHVGDARHAFQRIADLQVHIVAEEQAVIFAVLGVHARAKHEIAGRFANGNASGLHFVGHAAQRLIHAILNVHRGQVDVAADVERDVDAAGAVVAARRGHVLHAFDAVDGLLQWSGYRGFHRPRVSAVVERANAYLWRSQVRKLRDRKRGNGDRAGQDDQQRANRGEDRTAYKKIDKHFLCWPFYCAKERGSTHDQDGVFPSDPCGISVTGAPSIRFWPPSTTTRSPFCSPPSTT